MVLQLPVSLSFWHTLADQYTQYVHTDTHSLEVKEYSWELLAGPPHTHTHTAPRLSVTVGNQSVSMVINLESKVSTTTELLHLI